MAKIVKQHGRVYTHYYLVGIIVDFGGYGKSKILKKTLIFAKDFVLKMSFNSKKISFFVFAFLLSLSCVAQENVLFIGNSMTYYNDMPELFRQVSESKGKEVLVESFTRGGVGLAQHISEGSVFRQISSRAWDKVVLQPGTSESAGLSLQTDSLASMVLQLIDSIRHVNPNAKVIIYEISNGISLGSEGNGNYDRYLYTQGIIKDTVTRISMLSGIPFAPVGESFKQHYSTHRDLMLHNNFNDVHPNLKGSYLAACVLYSTLYEENVMPCNFYSSLTEAEATYLQSLTDSVVLPRREEWLMGENTYSHTTEYKTLIYPNPTTGIVNVEKEEAISVYDLTGRCIMDSLIGPILDLSMLKDGIYLIRVGEITSTVILLR